MNVCSLAPEDEDDRTRLRGDSGQGSSEGRGDRTYESVSVSLSPPSFAARLTVLLSVSLPVLTSHLDSPDLRLWLP
jgi:hypothetical protein